jgi:hypothetical protein
MLRLPRPNREARETFSTCISQVRNQALRNRLVAATDSVTAMSAAFDQAALQANLHNFPSELTVGPDVTTDEMGRVYTQRMAKAGTPGRAVYDELLLAPQFSRCPICMNRSATTLDHYLPKSRFPALAVTPLNLVPACSDCNKAKLAAFPTAAEEVGLHPYYDDLGMERWLRARVVESQPSAVKFVVAAPAHWDAVLVARVKRHFKLFSLGALFSTEAAEELVSIRHQLKDLRRLNPENGVKQEMRRRAESADVGRPNSWRAATYYAWWNNDWFCDGGFEHTG